MPEKTRSIASMHSHGRRHRGKQPRLERLAIEFLQYVRDLESTLLRRAPALNPDLQKCAASILANFGEGWDDPSPGDKKRLFRYAHRSAGEAERLLRGVRSLRIVPDARIDDGLRLLLDIKMDLNRLIRSIAP